MGQVAHAQCRLCHEFRELRESHVVPKFVFKWLKRTGAPGFRSPLAPNKRQQDGAKLKLLCDECEGRFSRLETKFANEFFWPHLNDEVERFEYDSSLYRFAISLFWRRLAVDPGVRPHLVKKACEELEPHLREFLLEENSNQLGESVHMVTMGETPGVTPVKFWNSYLTRMPDMCVAQDCHDNAAFAFAKLGPFQFYLDLSGKLRQSLLRAEVHEDGGTHRPGWEMGELVTDFLVGRARESRALVESGLSVSQRAKLEAVTKESLRSNPDSAHSRVLAMDLAAEPRPLPGSRRQGRNEQCFCGSGKKYKRCHGRAS